MKVQAARIDAAEKAAKAQCGYGLPVVVYSDERDGTYEANGRTMNAEEYEAFRLDYEARGGKILLIIFEAPRQDAQTEAPSVSSDATAEITPHNADE